MNKVKSQANTKVNQETLAYRNSHEYRVPKTGEKTWDYSKKSETPFSQTVQGIWMKENQTVYVLPLNTANEAKLIYYIDQLPSVKPYICDLIRKDMKNNEVKVTKSFKRDYNNNMGTKRLFNFKFNNKGDADIIEHLIGLKEQHISKRAYLIALIEKDIIDNNFKFPQNVVTYNRKNKVIKNKISDEFYRKAYHFIDTEIRKGNTTFDGRELRKFVNDRMDINPKTFASYWHQLFIYTGAVKWQEGTKCIYDINIEKFNELINPNEISK